ncbi:DUF2470 domain-containing protein [Streptomyces sp. NPDC015232]|uniref:DUF2470 domain-containing protein n=1 Tax=unclassified Streptomyces TaxID=2593676 RepID=UPI0036F7E412
MQPHSASGPSPAERLRSIIAAAHSMTVVTDGHFEEVHGLDGDDPLGRIHLHAPGEAHEHATPRIPIRLELTDVAPVPVRERVRARVTLSGLVAAPYRADSGASTCMELGQAVLQDARGRWYVTLDQLQEAAVDPLAVGEAPMLHHLVADHPELVPLLLRLVEPAAKQGLVRALPLGVDRYGITLRLERRTGHQDVRLPFPTPMTEADQAGLQIHALLTAARRSSHHRLPA